MAKAGRTVDGPGLTHYNKGGYLILDLTGDLDGAPIDPIAIATAKVYATECRESNPTLAEALDAAVRGADTPGRR